MSKQTIITASLVSLGLVLVAGFAAWQSNSVDQKLAATNDNINSLAKSIEVLAQNMSATGNIESQVVNALETIENTKIKQKVLEREKKFEQASNNNKTDKWIYGDIGARFTLVEFSDTECPYCKRFHDTPKKVVDTLQGMVNWEFVHLPLQFHNPAAEVQSIAMECVGQIKGNKGFWMMADDVFKHTRGNGQGVPDLVALAAENGVNKEQFAACMASEVAKKKVYDDMNKAQTLGIKGTPATFVVDNTTGKSKILSGSQPPEAFLTTIRAMAADPENKGTAN